MARLPFDGRYRVGPHGSYGFHRTPGNGRDGDEESWHFAVDMYPRNLEEYARAPERVRIVAVRTQLGGDGPLKGYGPGALRMRSEGTLSETLGALRVWHIFGHLRAADVARFAVGQVVEEGEPLGRVFVPQYSATTWRHLHYEIWRSASVPSGKDRGPHTYHPERWAAWRGAVDAAVTAGGVAAAAAVISRGVG